jgi:hypothetical protein
MSKLTNKLRLLNDYKPSNNFNAKQRLKAQATYYPNFVRVFIPFHDIYKLQPNLENRDLVAEIGSDNLIVGKQKETDLERSIRRSRKNIKDYILCNNFDVFATFTLKADRQDSDLSKRKITNWFHNEQNRKGKFSYLFVPEFHQDRKSLHFHALLNGYTGMIIKSLDKNGKPKKKKGRQLFTLPSYTHGFSDARYIDQNAESPTKLALYLQKYITKDMPLFFGKNRYRASHGLIKPKIEDNPQEWYLAVDSDRDYLVEEHGIILEFDRGTSPLVDMFIEANQP